MNAPTSSSTELGFLGFWSWHRPSGLVSASRELMTLFQIRAAVGDATRIDDYERHVHPDDVVWLRREGPRCFGPSGHSALEFRMSDPQGRTRWLMCRCIVVSDLAGVIRSAKGMTIDVTDLKSDGNTCRSAPAPLAHPLQTLIDSTLSAFEAAEQVGDDILIDQLRTVLQNAGHLMARQMARAH